MNNEPVAWFYAYPDDIEEKFLCSNSELIETMKRKGYTLTPLYAHPVKELTDEEILEAQKLFSNMHKNATESWGSLDLNNQSNLECARAWFIEGFAHGQKLKELTDEEIKDFLATFPIIFTVDDLCTFARAILRKAQEK